jgi:inorganic triphosphatase YgiF
MKTARAAKLISTENYEVELKLQPHEAEMLDRVWALDRVGSFDVISRRTLHLYNRYYDSPDSALNRAGGNLRWRTIEGSPEAELTYKGPSEVHGGVFRRLEVTTLLPRDVDPLVVEPMPEPVALARRATTDLGPTKLVLENDRRSMRLSGRDAIVELDLDITRMPGTNYLDFEIEGEMVEGNAEVLSELETALASVGAVTRSIKGKRARGWSFLKPS